MLRSLLSTPLSGLFAFTVFAAITPVSAQESPAASPVKSIFFQAAIYFVPEPLAVPDKVAPDVLRVRFADKLLHKTDNSPVKTGTHVAWTVTDTKTYPVPPENVLLGKGQGIVESVVPLLQTSRQVVTVEFLAAAPDTFDYIHNSNLFLYELARRTGGYIWDNTTRQMFSVEAWRARRLEVPADRTAVANTVIQSHSQGKNVRAVTYGMRKFGQPDFMVDQFTRGNWIPMGDLLYFLVNEASAAGPFQVRRAFDSTELRKKLNFPDGTLVPPLALVPIKPEPGDPDNVILTLDWSIYPGESLSDKQTYLIENLLVPDPEMTIIRANQRELLVLSAASRQKLADKQTRFRKGLVQGEEIRVKAWHRSEYVWMKIVDWKRDELECELLEDSLKDPERKAGAREKISINDVFDYIHVYPDGREEGNNTGKAIRALLERGGKEKQGQ